MNPIDNKNENALKKLQSKLKEFVNDKGYINQFKGNVELPVNFLRQDLQKLKKVTQSIKEDKRENEDSNKEENDRNDMVIDEVVGVRNPVIDNNPPVMPSNSGQVIILDNNTGKVIDDIIPGKFQLNL